MGSWTLPGGGRYLWPHSPAQASHPPYRNAYNGFSNSKTTALKFRALQIRSPVRHPLRGTDPKMRGTKKKPARTPPAEAKTAAAAAGNGNAGFGLDFRFLSSSTAAKFAAADSRRRKRPAATPSPIKPGLASSKRRFDDSHSEVLKEIEAFSTRISKGLKVDSCAVLARVCCFVKFRSWWWIFFLRSLLLIWTDGLLKWIAWLEFEICHLVLCCWFHNRLIRCLEWWLASFEISIVLLSFAMLSCFALVRDLALDGDMLFEQTG